MLNVKKLKYCRLSPEEQNLLNLLSELKKEKFYRDTLYKKDNEIYIKYDVSKNYLYFDSFLMGDILINEHYFISNLLELIKKYLDFDDVQVWLTNLNIDK